jgi:kinetochore protein Spc7/SPC105
MTYMREIELVFDASSFQPSQPNSRIDLWYIAANRNHDPQPATPEKEFFVQCIRDHIRSLSQAQTKLSDLLRMVSASWKKANHVAQNLRFLNSTFPTSVARTSDSSIAIRCVLLLVPLETKVQITLNLHSQHAADSVEVSMVPQAQVIYGEHFKIDKVAEFLATRIGSKVITKGEDGEVESWIDAIVELHEKLLARGRK